MKVSKKFIGLVCMISLLFVFVSCDSEDVDKALDKADEIVSENVDKVADNTDNASAEDSQEDATTEETDATAEDSQADATTEETDATAEDGQADATTEEADASAEDSQEDATTEEADASAEDSQADATTEEADASAEDSQADATTEETDATAENSAELEIMIINNNKDINNLWLGDSTAIDETKEMNPGETRVEKLSMKVSEENINDSLVVNIATDGKIVSTESINIEGTYVENKPVLVIWDGEQFTTSY